MITEAKTASEFSGIKLLAEKYLKQTICMIKKDGVISIICYQDALFQPYYFPCHSS